MAPRGACECSASCAHSTGDSGAPPACLEAITLIVNQMIVTQLSRAVSLHLMTYLLGLHKFQASSAQTFCKLR